MTGPVPNPALDLLREAMRLAPGKRRALIESRTANDLALRDRALRLLDQQESATMADVSVTPTLQGATTSTDEATSSTGLRRLGAYTILDILGEGGMGVVYLARQDNPARTVALKVIRAGVLSPRMLRRFEHEVQILGRLQHPGIAQIYEAGTADTGSGQAPFFAMELVRGVPITEYIHGSAFSTRDRLELFARVCDAVEHAHQKGVIHRDLKPGNILIDAAGQPKVLDFGVARATDADMQTATMQTEAGQLLGTVPYMSPEQVGGDAADLDTRSDVYTLGVILYELLAGRLPHAVAGKSLPEAVRIIGQDEPTPLGTVDRAYRGDLQTIVAKSLEKDKARRYDSASALAADIRRYLNNEPISARPASATYQFSKFARRNQGLVAAGAVGVLVLIGGIITTSWQAAKATRGERLAEERRQEADAQRKLAVEEAEVASSVNSFLTKMLSGADPESTAGREVTVRELLDAAAAEVEREPPTKPRVAGSVLGTLATTYESLGAFEKAEKFARSALESKRATFGEDAPETLDAMRIVVAVLADETKLEEAETLARDCYARAQRIHGPDTIPTAEVLTELARVLHESGKQEESTRLMQDSIAMFERAKIAPTDDRLLTAKHNYGTALKDAGNLVDAEKVLREVLDARIARFGEENPRTLYTFNGVAAVLARMNRLDEAGAMFERALAIRKKVLGPDHPGTLTLQSNLGTLFVQAGKLDKAEPVLREAIAGLTRTVGESHSKTLVAMSSLAYLMEDLKQEDQAEELYRKLITLRRNASGTGGRDPETWSPMNNLAGLLQRRGKLDEADALYREVLELCRASLAPDHPYLAIFENNHADCLIEMKRFADAETELNHSHPILEKSFGAAGARTTKSTGRYIRLYEAWNKPDQAAPWKARLAEATQKK